MLKINIVCVGKLKEKFHREAVDEYLKRLSRFANVEVKELSEGKGLAEEAPSILRAAKGYKIALCVEGKRYTSEGFASEMKKLYDKGEEITFIIGSSNGLSDVVKIKSDLRISFSDMTFPHQLMRIILVEQIYRAFMINSGGEYHK